MEKSVNIYTMKKKIIPFESVKIKSDVVNKVRKHREVTGLPISRFIQEAINEKLENIKK